MHKKEGERPKSSKGRLKSAGGGVVPTDPRAAQKFLERAKFSLKNNSHINQSLTNLQAPLLEKSNKSSITEKRRLKQEVRPSSGSGF